MTLEEAIAQVKSGKMSKEKAWTQYAKTNKNVSVGDMNYFREMLKKQ